MKDGMSLKPKPPFFFCCVSFSHEVQHIFVLSILESHQNRVKADWIRLHKDPVSLKQVIAYVGIDASTLFNITIFPAPERKHVDQLIALWRILSTIPVKRSFFWCPKCSGNPRYLPTPPSLLILSFFFHPLSYL